MTGEEAYWAGLGPEDAEPKPVEHGVQGAYYSGGPGEPYYQCVMKCCCGWISERHSSWQNAGEEFDEHLESVKP